MQVDVRGLPVHFERFGEGRPIVFLHGGGVDHRLMSVTFEPSFEDRRAWQRFYPDLPGMGRTPGPDWITSDDGVLDVVDGFVNAMAPDGGAAIVGASYGAYLAMGLVHRRGPDLAGVALVAPAVRADDPTAPPVPEVDARRDGVVTAATDAEQRWLDISLVHSEENMEFFRAAVLPGMELADTAFLERVDAGPKLPYDVRRPPVTFERPSLVVAGRQDSTVAWQDTVPLLASLPRATFAVLDRSGHAIPADQRHLLRALFGEWLDRLEGQAG